MTWGSRDRRFVLAPRVVRTVDPYVDTEIERYFDMTTIEMPLEAAIREIA
jgi:hypothetical protein